MPFVLTLMDASEYPELCTIHCLTFITIIIHQNLTLSEVILRQLKR